MEAKITFNHTPLEAVLLGVERFNHIPNAPPALPPATPDTSDTRRATAQGNKQ
jgi:hypothetical protein